MCRAGLCLWDNFTNNSEAISGDIWRRKQTKHTKLSLTFDKYVCVCKTFFFHVYRLIIIDIIDMSEFTTDNFFLNHHSTRNDNKFVWCSSFAYVLDKQYSKILFVCHCLDLYQNTNSLLILGLWRFDRNHHSLFLFSTPTIHRHSRCFK